MKLYEQAVRGDLIAPVRDMLDKGIVFINDKLQFEFLIKAYEIRGPWILVHGAPDRVCGKWLDVYWEKYRHLPKGCRGCWKVVAKVQNLEQTWKVYKLQEKLGLSSKCGMDRREWTFGVWAAFWYAPLEGGLEGARALWKRINDAVHAEVDPSIQVILKRGCTEIEAGIGPSDRWPRLTKEQEVFEELLDSMWPDGRPQTPTPMAIRMHYFAKWVRWAWAHGDATVLKFTEQPLMAPLVEYQSSVHSPIDFPVPIFDREIKGAVENAEPINDPSGLEMGTVAVKPKLETGIVLVS